jgi:hypothetical protein
LAGQLLCNTSANRGFIQQSVSLTAGQYALSVFVDSVVTTDGVGDLISILGATDLKFYEDGLEVIASTNIVAGKRYSVVGTVTTASISMRVGSGVNSNATANYVISRPQLEVSDFGATEYIATTTAAVSVGPVSGLPRLDYLNSSCPRLLLEPQRTNLALFSEQMDNAYWTKTRATITANNATSPDGYTNADKLVEDAILGSHFVDRTITGLTASAVHSFSIFAKKAEREFVSLQCVTNGNSVFVNLNNGAISIGGGYTSSTVKVESYSNSWYRITVNDTPPSTSLRYIAVTAINSSTISYTGDGTSGIYLWGAQLEAGAYPTSYIPTLGASVTRVADAASKTGISSLIGQTEGTLFVDFVFQDNDTSVAGIFSLSDGTTSNRIYIGRLTNRLLRSVVSNSGVTVAEIATATDMVVGQRYKAAIAYKANDFVFYVNGVQIGTDSSGAVPATSQIQNNSGAGASSMFNPINQALLFKTRLSNSDLAALTTL